MRTANPVLKQDVFLKERSEGSGVMTVMGTVHRTAFLLFLTLLTAAWSWSLTMPQQPGWGGGPQVSAMPFIWGGAIAGLVLALITTFKKKWSPFTAPLYALAEGVALGSLSAIFELQYPGIVVQAVMITIGTLLALLLAYRTGLIQVTPNFRKGVVAATGGIMLVYLLSVVLGLFGVPIPMIHESGPVGILFSLFVVVVAALNLVLDFDFIEQGAQAGAPKYMEWFGGFALLVTLIWLYIEVLRLLAKSRRR